MTFMIDPDQNFEMSFTLGGTTDVTLQHQEILRLPRNLNRMIDPRHA